MSTEVNSKDTSAKQFILSSTLQSLELITVILQQVCAILDRMALLELPIVTKIDVPLLTWAKDNQRTKWQSTSLCCVLKVVFFRNFLQDRASAVPHKVRSISKVEQNSFRTALPQLKVRHKHWNHSWKINALHLSNEEPSSSSASSGALRSHESLHRTLYYNWQESNLIALLPWQRSAPFGPNLLPTANCIPRDLDPHSWPNILI